MHSSSKRLMCSANKCITAEEVLKYIREDRLGDTNSLKTDTLMTGAENY